MHILELQVMTLPPYPPVCVSIFSKAKSEETIPRGMTRKDLDAKWKAEIERLRIDGKPVNCVDGALDGAVLIR